MQVNKCNCDSVSLSIEAARELANKALVGLRSSKKQHEKDSLQKLIARINEDIDTINAWWHSGWLNVFGRKPLSHVTNKQECEEFQRFHGRQGSGDHWYIPDNFFESHITRKYDELIKLASNVVASTYIQEMSLITLSLKTVTMLKHYSTIDGKRERLDERKYKR